MLPCASDSSVRIIFKWVLESRRKLDTTFTSFYYQDYQYSRSTVYYQDYHYARSTVW